MQVLSSFQQETRQLLHQRIPTILLANMALMALLAVFDLVFPVAAPAGVLAWRMAAITVCGLLLVLNRQDRQQRWTWPIALAGSLCTGSVLIVLLVRTDTIASPAYATLIAVITIFTAIAPLTAAQALSCGFALVCGYLGAIVGLDFLPPAELMTLAGNLFFLICFVFIAAIQCWADHGAREREYRLRLAESAAAVELERQAGRLEEEVRRRTGEQRSSEQRYRLLYEAITDDLVLVDRDGIVLQANDRHLARFGVSPNAGASFCDAVFPADRDRVGTELLAVLFRD
jgi:PAS domain-containing protein